MKYAPITTVDAPQMLIYGSTAPVKPDSYGYTYPAVGNCILPSQLFNCCGLSSMSSFGKFVLRTFEDKAEYLAGLWVNTSKTILYAISGSQSRQIGMEHALFVEIGAKLLAEFPNRTHSSSGIQLWLVDLTNAKGKYLSDKGAALKEAPPAAVVVPPVPKPRAPRKTKEKQDVE